MSFIDRLWLLLRAVVLAALREWYGEQMARRGISENLESKAFVRWVRDQPELRIAHMPNELLGQLEPAHLKHQLSMGCSLGFPDYIIVNRRTHKVAIIEMKKRRGGKRPANQQAWIAAFGKRGRFCNGYHEARRFIEEKLL